MLRAGLGAARRASAPAPAAAARPRRRPTARRACARASAEGASLPRSPSDEPPPNKLVEDGRVVLVAGAGVLALEAVALVSGGLFNVLGLELPPAVAGFILATAALMVAPAKMAKAVSKALEPAHSVLERYTGLIFVPYIVLLFTSGLPPGAELVRGLAACAASWLVVTTATAWTVSIAENMATGRAASEATESTSSEEKEEEAELSACPSGAISLLDSVFSLGTCVAVSFLLGGPFLLLRRAALRGGIAAATRASLVVPLRLMGTVAVYRAAQRVPVLGGLFPTLISGAIVAISLLASGGASAVELYMRSAGAALLWMVTPSIVACSLSAYYSRKALSANVVPLLAGLVVGVPMAMATGALMARVFGLSEAVGMATLAKHNMSRFAVEIANALGVSPGLACAACVVTGILGVCVLPPLLDVLGIRSQLARGVAAGASSHGAGTLGLAARGEAEASAFASTTFALGGAVAVLLVSIAPFRSVLLALAGYA